MNTKKILGMLLVLTLTALCSAGCGGTNGQGEEGDAAAPVVIQVGYENNPGEPIDRACVKWQELLSEASGGTVELELFPSSQLGSKDEILDQMLTGVNVITLLNGGIYADRGVKDFGIVFSPYLFESWDDMDKLIASDWWSEQTAECEEIGFKVLASNWRYGARHTLTKTPINSVTDLVGKKIRVPNNTYQVKGIEAVGATPTPMGLSEVYTALQQGTVDGEENPLTTLAGQKFQEVAKYLILDGHIYDQTTWACGKDFFDTLTTEQQDWLISTAEEAGVYNNQLMETAEEEVLKEMTEGGVVVGTFNYEEFKAAAQSYYEDSTLLSQWSDGLVDRIKAIIEK